MSKDMLWHDCGFGFLLRGKKIGKRKLKLEWNKQTYKELKKISVDVENELLKIMQDELENEKSINAS